MPQALAIIIILAIWMGGAIFAGGRFGIHVGIGWFVLGACVVMKIAFS